MKQAPFIPFGSSISYILHLLSLDTAGQKKDTRKEVINPYKGNHDI